MSEQCPNGKLCGLQPNFSSPYAVTKHPSLLLTMPACTSGLLCQNDLPSPAPVPWQQPQSLMITARLSALELNDTLPLHIME